MATPIPQNVAEFSSEELVMATGGKVLQAGAVRKTSGVATDTREDLSGKVFVALSGDRFNGHEYLSEAVRKGAQALIVSEDVALEGFSRTTVVRVADTLEALGGLAALHRSRWGGKVVAVAGSAGKTTTRSVISKMLEELLGSAVHSTVGNLNNRIGVPMILLGLCEEHSHCVVELGTNQPGEVAALSKMARPDVAVLTLIDLEHTEGLGDLDGVEAEEGSVFQYLASDGVAIGFGEDKRVLRQIERARGTKISYGFSEGRDVRITSQALIDACSCEVTLTRGEQELRFKSSLMGRPGALAAAAGVAAVEATLGQSLSATTCEAALAQAGEPGRSQVVLLSGDRVVVDDTYNSNPASVENSIGTGRALAERSGGRLWLVLGEMLELGKLSKEAHVQMGEMAAHSGAAGAFFVRGDARFSFESARKSLAVCAFFEDAGQVAEAVIPEVRERDVVVVKASRGVRAERVVQDLKAFYKSAPAPTLQTSSEGGGSSS